MKPTTIAGIAAAMILPSAAGAATLYENPFNTGIESNASCMFNVPCAALFDLPPSQGGQAFSLANAATIRSASFTELDNGALPTTIRWTLLDDDGTFGAPKTAIASGEAGVSDFVSLGVQGAYQRNKVYFNLPSIDLDAGSYVLALQVVAPTISNFLVEGQAFTGAWQKFGDEPWMPRYGGSSAAVSVAVGLYDTARPAAAPEPAAWALMICGFGMSGSVLRRRRTSSGR